MNKRKPIILTVLLAGMLVCACSRGSYSDTARAKEDIRKQLAKAMEYQEQSEIFQVEGYDIRIETPGGWEETDAVNFDLQCLSPKSDMYLSVYGYYRMDISEDQTARDLFEEQNHMILDIRNHVKEIEPVSMEEDDKKTVYSALYSGERDGHKNYYYMNMVEFHDSDQLAWILFTGVPSVIENNRETLDSILSNVTAGEPDEE